MRRRIKLKRLILIGDPEQQPPVIQAPTLNELSNQLSLTFFQRMELIGIPVQLLNSQYLIEQDIANIIHIAGG